MACHPRRRPPSRAVTECGQATVEYVGLLGIIAALFVVVVVGAQAAGITSAVVREFKHALCIVSGEACDAPPPPPCTLHAAETGVKATADVVFVKLGGKASYALIERSDGSVDVVEIKSGEAGGTSGVGAGAHVSLGGHSIGAEEEASADITASLTGKRTWHTKDRDAAVKLIKRLAENLAVDTGHHAIPLVGGLLSSGAHKLGIGGHVPKPDITSIEGGIETSAEAKLGGLKVADGLGASVGRSHDDDTGKTTYTFGLSSNIGGNLAETLSGLKLEGKLEGAVSIVYGPDGRAQLLRVTLSGSAAGNLKLPGPARKVKPGEKLELTDALDLTVPGNLAVANEVIAHLSPGQLGGLPPALAALGRRMLTDGRLDLARYGSSASSYGAGGEGALGGKLGGDVELSTTSTQLEDAYTRTGTAPWVQRADCLRALAS